MSPLQKPSSRRGQSWAWKRNFSRSFDGLLPAVALSLAITTPSAFAATLTWDTNSTNGATIDVGNGNWNTTAGNTVWNNGSTNVAWTQTSTTDGSNAAVFAGTDGTANQYTVTLGAQMATESVTFNSSGYRITGSTLAIMPTTSLSGTITVAAGKTATINSILRYMHNVAAVVTVNSGGTLNLGGGTTTSNNPQFSFSGAGTINLNAGTFTNNAGTYGNAVINVTGGTHAITPGNNVGPNISSATQDVAYNLSGGTLTVNGNATTATVNGAHIGIGSTTGTAFTSALNVSSGTMNVGTVADTSGEIQIAKTAASNGTLNVSGGTVTVGASSTANEIYFFKAGSSAGYTANMIQSGGTVTTNGIQVGGTAGTYSATSAANLTVSGGSLYIGAQGISRSSSASAQPFTIKLQGGTIGASDNWSSSLDMKLGATGGGPTIRAANSAGVANNITLSGVLSDDASVNGSLTKSGTGTLTLSGSNTYTGSTTINAGTLLMGASNVLPDATNVSIGDGILSAATFTDTAGTLDVTASTSAINLGSGAVLEFADSSAVSWSGGTLNITGNFVPGTSLRFGTSSAGLTASQLSSITAEGIASFALNSDGYLIDAPPPPLVANDAIVGFPSAVSGSTTFVLAGSATSTITLTFSINNAGLIALDASTNATNDTFSTAVNAWDNSNVGSVGDAALLGKTFSLTGTASGGGNLTLTSNGGGGVGIQGENSNRVDGLNYGVSGTSSMPETLTWTLNAPPGLALGLKNWSYVDGALSDIRVSNGTTNSDFANLVGTTGTSALSNFQLNNGESLTFKEIPGIGETDGAGISGFSFEVIPVAITEYAFDNGGGDNLWTNSANWFPNGTPASVSDAIIDGYDVSLNSAASSSIDELLIPNGTLTLSGSGALSLRAMTIGRDLTKTVRLVMNGSSVSFGYSGSFAADQFAVGAAATVETKPDSSGCETLELGAAKLVLDAGAQWILDGANANSFSYDVGDRFVLANFGSFQGETIGIRTRNFDLPADRRLQLVATSTTIYYEVVAQTAPTGPNIIIINTDDQAADQHFGFDGRNCITPTMDSLVAGGIKFNAAFCTSAVCGASRYSMLTSRWPSRNTSDNFIAAYPLGTLGRFGVSDTELEHDRQNIGAWLQQAGYRTGFVGKCHVLDDSLHDTADWPAAGLLTYSTSADPATNATVNAAMQFNHRLLCQRMRAHGFDFVDAFYHANLKELFNTKLNVHNQEWITSRALKFIEENRNERFFLYMAPTINHGPVNSNLDYTLRADPRYTSAGFLPDEDYTFMPTRASIISQVQGAGKDLISARETWLDYSIKAIVDKLTAYGIRNDTLIIFTSDHGEKSSPGTSNLVWGKTTLYDLGMKVPMFMNWPNGITAPGRQYNELISHVDLAATFLDMAGVSHLPTRPVDGVSLASVLKGTTSAERNAPVREAVFNEIGYARGVRTKTHKYIAVRYTPSVYSQIASGYRWPKYVQVSGSWVVDPNGGTIARPYYVNNSGLGALGSETNPTYFDDDQLYNLANDPNENTNIYGQDPAAAYELKKRLANYIGSIPDRPFRQFSDSSKEFSPAPTSAPTAPGSGSVNMTFNSLNQVQLTWTDSANSELGYVIRKTVNGGTPVIVGEYPPGTTSATVNLDSGVEDILLQVASYNTVGDSAVNQDMLSPDPWRYRTFGGSDPTLTGPASQWDNDADGDGVSTMWEYAAGTNPLSASSVAKPEMRMTTESSNRFLEYVLPRSSRRGVQFQGAVSTDLSTWQSGSPHCTVVEEGASQMIFRSATPVSGAARQFIRAEMIDPPNAQP